MYGLIISKPIVILVGMIIASCGNAMYGTTYWVSLSHSRSVNSADRAELVGLFQCHT